MVGALKYQLSFSFFLLSVWTVEVINATSVFV